jgi:hypothetical protein
MINLNFGDYVLNTFFDFVIVIDIGTSSMYILYIICSSSSSSSSMDTQVRCRCRVDNTQYMVQE